MGAPTREVEAPSSLLYISLSSIVSCFAEIGRGKSCNKDSSLCAGQRLIWRILACADAIDDTSVGKRHNGRVILIVLGDVLEVRLAGADGVHFLRQSIGKDIRHLCTSGIGIKVREVSLYDDAVLLGVVHIRLIPLLAAHDGEVLAVLQV